MNNKTILLVLTLEVICILIGIIFGMAITYSLNKNKDLLNLQKSDCFKEVEVEYSASDFDIRIINSIIDFNNNGIDDYTDILNGAKMDAKNRPFYLSKYYDGGYPPEDEGVCTDLIWRAFKNAGYSLKDMIDYDIFNNPTDYPNIEDADSNIDFRRVLNQNTFFKKYCTSLTLNPNLIEEWQPGDIVVIEEKHIGIISDIRNEKGIAYVIHNTGQADREEDYLLERVITAHYRFDASKISKEVLKKWHD